MRRALMASLAVLVLVSCGRSTSSIPSPLPIARVTLHGSDGAVHLTVEEADSPQEREQGLMGRSSLGANDGMVFIFDGSTQDLFWMKDTLIPLSIAFWDEGGRIVGIQDMDPCTADPCPTYGSPAAFVGALEVNEGFFRDHEVSVGDSVTVEHS